MYTPTYLQKQATGLVPKIFYSTVTIYLVVVKMTKPKAKPIRYC